MNLAMTPNTSRAAPLARPPELSLQKVAVRFDHAVLNVSPLRIAGGERVLIHGPSGSGKSTLLHLAAGLLRPMSGEVRVGSQELAALNDAQLSALRRRYFGMVFQTLNLLSHLTPAENIELALPDAKDARARGRAALAAVGMLPFADAATAVLSVGQRQRVAVARVLAARPQLILADEPTSSLDQDNTDLVMDALFSAAANATLVVVSHDARVRARFPVIYAVQDLITAEATR